MLEVCATLLDPQLDFGSDPLQEETAQQATALLANTNFSTTVLLRHDITPRLALLVLREWHRRGFSPISPRVLTDFYSDWGISVLVGVRKHRSILMQFYVPTSQYSRTLARVCTQAAIGPYFTEGVPPVIALGACHWMRSPNPTGGVALDNILDDISASYASLLWHDFDHEYGCGGWDDDYASCEQLLLQHGLPLPVIRQIRQTMRENGLQWSDVAAFQDADFARHGIAVVYGMQCVCAAAHILCSGPTMLRTTFPQVCEYDCAFQVGLATVRFTEPLASRNIYKQFLTSLFLSEFCRSL